VCVWWVVFSTVIYIFRVVILIAAVVFCCQYECKWLAGRTCLINDLSLAGSLVLCVIQAYSIAAADVDCVAVDDYAENLSQMTEQYRQLREEMDNYLNDLSNMW